MPDDKKNVAKVSETLISSRTFRKAFNNDPFAAAKAIGVTNLTAKDLGSIDVLTALSDDELEVLAKIRTKMVALDPDIVSDVIGGVIF